MFFHSLSDSREPLVRARRAAGRPDSLHLTPLRICTVVMPPSRETRYKNSGDANFRSFHLHVIWRRLSHCRVASSRGCSRGRKLGGGGVGALPTRLSRSSATGRALTTTISCVYTKAQSELTPGRSSERYGRPRGLFISLFLFHFFSLQWKWNPGRAHSQ